MPPIAIRVVRLVESYVRRVDEALQTRLADWAARTDAETNARERAALDRIESGEVGGGLTPNELSERWKIERKKFAS